MKLYHGSSESGIVELCPISKDKAGNPSLYLTDNYAYSLFYLRDKRTDFVTCGVAADGKVHYDEWFPNQLKRLYEGRSGWVYEVEANAEPYHTRGIYACRERAAVSRQIYVEDAYTAIMEEIEKGAVVLRTYEEATDEQLQLYRDGMTKWLRAATEMSAEKRAFYQTYFPECWEKAIHSQSDSME